MSKFFGPIPEVDYDFYKKLSTIDTLTVKKILECPRIFTLTTGFLRHWHQLKKIPEKKNLDTAEGFLSTITDFLCYLSTPIRSDSIFFKPLRYFLVQSYSLRIMQGLATSRSIGSWKPCQEYYEDNSDYRLRPPSPANYLLNLTINSDKQDLGKGHYIYMEENRETPSLMTNRQSGKIMSLC